MTHASTIWFAAMSRPTRNNKLISRKWRTMTNYLFLLFYFLTTFLTFTISAINVAIKQPGESLTIQCPMLSEFYDTSKYVVHPNLILVRRKTSTSPNDVVVNQEEILDLFVNNVRTGSYLQCPDGEADCRSIIGRFATPSTIDGGVDNGSRDRVLFNWTSLDFNDGGSRIECQSQV